MQKIKIIVEDETQPQNFAKLIQKQLKEARYNHKQLKNQVNSNQNHIEFQVSLEIGFSSHQGEKKNKGNQISRETDYKEMLEQFKKSILEKLNKLYYLYIPKDLFETICKKQYNEEYDQLEQVQEVIQKIFASQDQISTNKLLFIIQQNLGIISFLQWVYDSIPLLFCKELIYVTCKLIMTLQQLKALYPTTNFIHLLENNTFMNYIFNDPSLKFFKLESQLVGLSSFILTAPLEVMNFISYYTHKVFELQWMDLEKIQIINREKQIITTHEDLKQPLKVQRRKKIRKVKNDILSKNNI